MKKVFLVFLLLLLATPLASCSGGSGRSVFAEMQAYQEAYAKQVEENRIAAQEKAKQIEENAKQREERHAIYREQVKTADCGPLGDWQTVVKNGIRDQLKDPGSAQFKFDEFGEPRKSFTEFNESRVIFHWTVMVKVNAKNSYGGYVGYKDYIVKFRDGKALDVWQVPN